MRNETRLFAGAFVMIAAATTALVALPYLQLHDLRPPKGLHPYTSAQLRGRQVYIREGCIFCHSQQPRDQSQAPDGMRGWGRPSVPGDYFYDTPHLLGTMRTGPDLFNIAARQPSKDWQLGHLYQPRAYVPGSIMPAFPFLFEVKPQPEPGDQVVVVSKEFAPTAGVVVARPAALDLISYLLSLDHTYPVVATNVASPSGASR
jgi:cytochrome c oxidase cbb3-type subunit 2